MTSAFGRSRPFAALCALMVALVASFALVACGDSEEDAQEIDVALSDSGAFSAPKSAEPGEALISFDTTQFAALSATQVRALTTTQLGNLEAAVGGTRLFTHDLQRSRDFANFKEFQHVTLLDFVVILDSQAALEVLTHLFGIVFEALERIQLTRVDDHVLAQQT